MRVFIISLVVVCAAISAFPAFAALPTLGDLQKLIPDPVENFFKQASNFDFKFEAQDDGTSPVVQFLKAIWYAFLGLLRGVGSVFVWIFQGIANGLESLILSR